LEYASDELKQDREVVEAAAFQDLNSLRFAGDKPRSDVVLVLALVEEHGWYAVKRKAVAPGLIPGDVLVDPAMTLAAVKAGDPDAFKFAPAETKSDVNAFKKAIGYGHRSLKYAATNVKADRDVVLAIVSENGDSLEEASDHLKDDREIIMAAVKQSGLALREASTALKKDREIVMQAVQQDGSALQYAAEELRADPSMVMVAVRSAADGDIRVLQFAADSVKNNKEAVLEIVKINGMELEHVAAPLQHDTDVCLAAVENDPWVMMHHVPLELRSNPEIQRVAFRQTSK